MTKNFDHRMNQTTTGFVRVVCKSCEGTGELRIDSEHINEHFEVEKQTVITDCPACRGLGFIPPEPKV